MTHSTEQPPQRYISPEVLSLRGDSSTSFSSSHFETTLQRTREREKKKKKKISPNVTHHENDSQLSVIENEVVVEEVRQ